MLISELSDQFRTQMFAYAALKTIAIDLGMDFRIICNLVRMQLINNTEVKFGNSIYSIFPNTQNEYIDEVPSDYKLYRENTTIHCKIVLKKDALNVEDNTLLVGHYICLKYFEHRIDEVRRWFEFPEEIELISSKLIDDIKEKIDNKDAKLVSVQFRYGHDYRSGGFMLNGNYWFKAAKRLKKLLDSESVFVVFYDKRTKLVNYLSKNIMLLKYINLLLLICVQLKNVIYTSYAIVLFR